MALAFVKQLLQEEVVASGQQVWPVMGVVLALLMVVALLLVSTYSINKV